MWLLKVKILCIFVTLINVGCSSPIDENFYDDRIRESKFKISPDSTKGLKLLDELTTYRLPNDSIPLHYNIRLSTEIHSGNFSFDGNVKIHVQIVSTTDKITLHYKDLTIDSINLWDVDLTNIIIPDVKFTFIESHDFLVLNLTQSYNPGAEFVLDIVYKSTLHDIPEGFYWGSYINDDQEEKFYAATQFEIFDARHAMPCYDEPGIRAVMELKIRHHNSYSAISNTDVQGEVFDGEYRITQFKPTQKMQTYLLAFVISDFQSIEANRATRIPQKIYATPMAIYNGEGDFAASVIGEILAKFEQILGIECPLDKMDHVALTKLSFSAMENFGLITYINRVLLLDPTLSESAKFNQQSTIISLIVHEYAHQWFGNIISPQWWQYTWLNEGFATLFENYVTDLLYPQRNFMRNFYTSTMLRAFSSDEMGSWAMNHYTEQPNELWNKFSNIGYEKSGSVLRMFMEVLTPPVFLNGLNLYLHQNFMKAATPNELHIALQQAYDTEFTGNNLNIDQVMYSWEDQPGYPLISVSVVENTIVFEQRRYPESNGELYAVPITIATKTNPNFTVKTPKVWLNAQTVNVSQTSIEFTSNDWIIANIEQIGYYRVDYDSTLWRAIITQLNNNHEVINPINRAVLQDEIYLAWINFNRVIGSDVLSILSYFDREKDAIVWERATQTIDDMNTYLFGTKAYEKFLEMLKTITMPHLTEFGYENIDGEHPDALSLRKSTKLWSCRALDGQCVIREYQKLQIYLNGGEYGNINLCDAMRLIDSDGFAKGIEIILFIQNDFIRTEFINNLGCSLDPGNQIELLKVIQNTTNTLESSDRENLLFGMFRNSEKGFDVALSFISGNYARLAQILDIYQIMYDLTYGAKEEPYVSRVNSIINLLNRDGLITYNKLQILVEKVSLNLKWMEENYLDISEYFGLNEETTTVTTPSTTTELLTTTSKSTTTTDQPGGGTTLEQSTTTTSFQQSTTKEQTSTSEQSTTNEQTTTNSQPTSTESSTTTTMRQTDEPTTPRSTPRNEDTTTEIISTTPNSSHSIVISMSLITFFIIVNFLKI